MKKLTKGQKKIQKAEQDGRALAFHLFKGHKKIYVECTPCKHVVYFLKYEWEIEKKPYGGLEYIGPTIAPKPNQYPGLLGTTIENNAEEIKIGDDYLSVGTAGSTTTTTPTSITTTEGHYNPTKPMIVVPVSKNKSFTHVSPYWNKQECTTLFKSDPSVSNWKSHVQLCSCGETSIKWINK